MQRYKIQELEDKREYLYKGRIFAQKLLLKPSSKMADIDNKQVKSKRDAMAERLRNRYPDKDFSDDEAFFGQISDDYDEYDKNISDYQEREKAFSDMFTSDPRSARFINDWRNGEDPAVGLVRMFGTEIKEAIDDPERQEEMAAANKEFVERVAKEKELEELYQTNIDASLKELERMQQEEGMNDEQIGAAMRLLLGIIQDGIVGKFTPESIHLALKAINHDADVTAANEEGVVQGKNTKVEEKLRKPKKGDGTAPLGGANSTAKQPRQRPSLGALERFGGSGSIWDRGNEKRRRTSE